MLTFSLCSDITARTAEPYRSTFVEEPAPKPAPPPATSNATSKAESKAAKSHRNRTTYQEFLQADRKSSRPLYFWD
jgi:hypothetical protein